VLHRCSPALADGKTSRRGPARGSEEAYPTLGAMEQSQSACSPAGAQGDLMLLHFRNLRRVEPGGAVRGANCSLPSFGATSSYLSVFELGLYEST